jgi:hypothetical protein
MSTPLGHRIYLGPKGMGDNSMFGKRMALEAVEVPIRETRVTWRKLNCLNPRVHTAKTSGRVERLRPGVLRILELMIKLRERHRRGLDGNEPSQGPERDAYITLTPSITTGRRDCLRGASPMVTETP